MKKQMNEHIPFPYIDMGEGIPIVFLPGWSVTPKTYESDIKNLAKQFRIIAPYLRECSSSASVHEKIDILIETLHLTKPFLLGHSVAGVTAIEFAKYHEEKISGLILVNSMGLSHKMQFFQWVRIWFAHVKKLVLFKKRKTGMFLVGLGTDFFFQMIRHPHLVWGEAIHVINKDITHDLENLSLPILIIWGRDDDLTPVAYGYEMEYLSRRSDLVVLPGGHDAIKFHPQLFAKEVTSFIQKTYYGKA